MSELFEKTKFQMNKPRKSFHSYANIKKSKENDKKIKTKKVIYDEEELLKALFDYFVDPENVGCFTCANEKMRLLSAYSMSSNTHNFKQSNSMPFISTKCLRDASVNRCYFTSIQINVAQTYKNIDFDYDNKLNYYEFNKGVKRILLEKDLNGKYIFGKIIFIGAFKID